MLDWLILFALMFVLGFVATITGNAVHTSIFSSIVFGCLFLVGLLSRAARGSAW
jgi:hypothetical protein